MDSKRIAEITAEGYVDLGPNFEVLISCTGPNSYITMVYRCQDVEGRFKHKVPITLERVIPTEIILDHLQKEVRSMYMELMEHEFQEWFKVDGKYRYDPHKTGRQTDYCWGRVEDK